MKNVCILLLGVILLFSTDLMGEKVDIFSCIEGVLDNSNALKSAAADLNNYRQNKIANYASFIPQISVQSSATYDIDENQIGEYGLTASQKISLFDDRFSNISYYESAVKRQTILYQKERQNEALKLINSYLELLNLRYSSEYYQSAKEEYQSEILYIEELAKIGTRSELDKLSAQIELKNLELNIKKMDREISVKLIELSNMTGFQITNVDDIIDIDITGFHSKESISDLYIENNPNWKTQNLTNKMVKADKNKNFFNLLPDLFLQGYYSWKQMDYWEDSKEIYDYEGNYITRDINQEYWEVSLNLSLEFGSWFQSYSSYKIASNQYKKEIYNLNELRNSLNIDLISKQADLNYYREELQLNNEKKQLSERKYSLAQERFRSGLINFLDYKTAQNELMNSKVDQVKSRNSFFYANALWQAANGDLIMGKY